MSESGATEREPDPTGERLARRGGAGEPDVLLDIPEVTVDQIRLAVDGLDADLSLRARLANLLQIDAGVRVHLEGVELDVTGVSAQALLKVRLEKLVTILDRALATIDRNPQVIDALARMASISIDDVNRAAQQLTGGEGVPVVNEGGQQVGVVGAVADQTLRERVAEVAPVSPAPPVGTQPPEPPTGPRGPAPPGGPTAAAPSGPGEPSAPTVGAGPAPGGPGPGEPAGVEPGQPSGETRGAKQAPGGAAGGRPAGRGGRVEGGAAQMAGETLRQAGRSVWEAIQGGMGQGRQQRPKR